MQIIISAMPIISAVLKEFITITINRSLAVLVSVLPCYALYWLYCLARSCDCVSSIRPSVTLVDQDHIGLGWKSWTILTILRYSKPNTFSLRSPKAIHLLLGEHAETLKRFLTPPLKRWGGNSGVLEHKSGNISETRKDRGKVTRLSAYRNSPTLFRTVPSSPYTVWELNVCISKTASAFAYIVHSWEHWCCD